MIEVLIRNELFFSSCLDSNTQLRIFAVDAAFQEVQSRFDVTIKPRFLTRHLKRKGFDISIARMKVAIDLRRKCLAIPVSESPASAQSSNRFLAGVT